MGELAKNPASFAQVNTMSAANAIQALSVVLDAAAFNSQDQNKLLALVQASDDDEDSGAPAAAVYKSKAGGIVDVIEDMKEKAEGQLADLRKALSVLQEYYGAASASMLQDEQPAKPAGHQKSSGAGGSIIDILQTVESDFATNLA